jgi:MFS family permease
MNDIKNTRFPYRAGFHRDVISQPFVIAADSQEGKSPALTPYANARTGRGETWSRYAWLRLAGSLALTTIGGVGMWSFMVALPTVQTDFGIARGDASVPVTLMMSGFALGGVLMGRLADRFGVAIPIICGTMVLGLGYAASAYTTNVWQLAAAYGLIGIGSSATFGPLMTDASLWFTHRRGIAVAIVASGNYLAGTVWPPIVQAFIAGAGWRPTHVGIGLFCVATMLPLAVLSLRRKAPMHDPAPADTTPTESQRALGLNPNGLQALLVIAGVACCVAMAMPQVHIVAYCGDLGYGVARGAEMLSVMMGFGIVSRLASGFIADRIGGVATLLLGSVLQGVALFLYLLFDGLASLYVISALFGLFQGGIVAMYAIIVREYFPPQEAGTRLGIILMATLGGMALGGWMSGAIFDLTGSYRAAFANGLLWNLLNGAIAFWLLLRPGRRLAPASP